MGCNSMSYAPFSVLYILLYVLLDLHILLIFVPYLYLYEKGDNVVQYDTYL